MSSSYFSRLVTAAAATGILIAIPTIAQSQMPYASPSASPVPCGETNMSRTSNGNQPINSSGSASNSPSGTSGATQPGSLTADNTQNCPSPGPGGKMNTSPMPSASPSMRP
jgi:hypothetical protein